MAEALLTYKFWIITATSTLAVFIVGRLLAGYWKRGSHQYEIRWEAFSSPANNAVTVAGVVIPLIAGLFTYSASTIKQPPEQLSPLAASIILMGLSIIMGLWISFSLATTAGKDGTFHISATKNTYYPAFLVSQLLLLLLGFSLVAYYCFSSLALPAPSEGNTIPRTTSVQLLKPRLSVGITEHEAIKLWGEPLERLATPPGEQLKYISTESEFLVKIYDGEIVEVIERKIALKKEDTHARP